MKKSVRFTRTALALAVIIAVGASGRFALGMAPTPGADASAPIYEILEKVDRPVEFSFTITASQPDSDERNYAITGEAKIGDKIYVANTVTEPPGHYFEVNLGEDISSPTSVIAPFFGKFDADKEVAIRFFLGGDVEKTVYVHAQLVYQNEVTDNNGPSRRLFYVSEQTINYPVLGEKYVMTFSESVPAVVYHTPDPGVINGPLPDPTLVAGQKPPVLIFHPDSAKRDYPYASIDYVGVIVTPDAENPDNALVNLMVRSQEHAFRVITGGESVPLNTSRKMFVHLSDQDRFAVNREHRYLRNYLNGTNHAFNMNISAIPIANEDGTYNVKVKLHYIWQIGFSIPHKGEFINNTFQVLFTSTPTWFFLFENIQPGQLIAITDFSSEHLEELDGFEE